MTQEETTDNSVTPEMLATDLVKLLKTRQELYVEITNGALDILRPTLLTALESSLEVDSSRFEWTEVDFEEGYILVSFFLTISEDDVRSELVSRLWEMRDEEEELDNEIQRFMKFGIPIELSFAPIDTLREYIGEVTQEMISHDNGIISSVVDLDLDYDEDENNDQENNSTQSTGEMILRTSDGFDSSKLTRAQRKAIAYQQTLTKDKVH